MCAFHISSLLTSTLHRSPHLAINALDSEFTLYKWLTSISVNFGRMCALNTSSLCTTTFHKLLGGCDTSSFFLPSVDAFTSSRSRSSSLAFVPDSGTSSSSVSVPPFFFASNSRNRSFSRTTFSAASKYSKYSTYPFSSRFPPSSSFTRFVKYSRISRTIEASSRARFFSVVFVSRSFGDKDFERERFKFSFSKSSSFPTTKRDESLFDCRFVFFKFVDMNPNKRFATFPGAILLFLLLRNCALSFLSLLKRRRRGFDLMLTFDTNLYLCRLSVALLFLNFLP